MQLLHRTFRLLDRVRQKELDKIGVTARQSATMRAILRLGEDATITQISQQLAKEINTISEQVKRMEKEDLVEKVETNQHKGKMYIKLTEKGYELQNQTRKIKSINYLFSVLSEEEKDQLWAILAKLRGRAIKKLGVDISPLYPPADPKDIGL